MCIRDRPNIDECILEEYLFRNFSYAIDVIYNPQETEFIKRAKRNGLLCASGRTMLIWRAIHSQEIWQDRTFDNTLFNLLNDYTSELL